MIELQSGVPVPPPPNKNKLQRLNVVLPWGTMDVEESFFVLGGKDCDRSAVWMAASRRGFKIRTELNAQGMRVWRTG